MNEAYTEAIERLIRVPGVRGALLIDAQAGVPVVGEMRENADAATLAALSATLFRRAQRSVDAAGSGDLRTLQLEAESGHLLMVQAGEFMVAVITATDAQLGRVRLELRRAAGGLA